MSLPFVALVLISDGLDNRQLAYATELWLAERGQPVEHYRFGDSLQLTAYELQPPVRWEAIPPEPPLTVLVNPKNYTFNGIAALLGWHWPNLEKETPPILHPGQKYPFALYWIYRGKAPTDTFFVRLLNTNGQITLETALTPRPDNHLIPGQLLIEDTTLSLPPDFPPGTYHLQIGFFIPVVETGELLFDLPPELTAVTVGEN